MPSRYASGTARLRDQLAGRGGVSRRQLARDVDLRRDDRLDGVVLRLLGKLLLEGRDTVHELLVAVEVEVSGALADLDETLVELGDLLGGVVQVSGGLGGGTHGQSPWIA